jgi:acyl carrier protein
MSIVATAPDQVRQQVLDIVAGLFGLDTVPEHAGFFDLGGDSLLAMKVLGRVSEAAGTDVSLVTLYEAATLAEFADAVAAATVAATQSSPYAAGTDSGASIIQESSILEVDEGQWPSRPISVAFRVHGAIDEDRLRRALSSVMAAHESLRTQFRRDGDTVRRVVIPDVEPPLVVDPSGGAEDDLEWIQRWMTPFDFGTAPLFRVVWRKRSGDRHLLLLVFDHIIIDGWSLQLFCERLSLAYTGESLVAEPVSFGQWARWQRERLSGAHLASLVERGRKLLDEGPEMLGTPLEGYRAGADPIGLGLLEFRVDAATTVRLRELGRSLGVSTFAVLLGAFALAVSEKTDRTRLVFNTSTANRRLPAHEHIIGPLYGHVPVVVDLAGAGGLAEAARRAHTAVAEANELSEIPYAMRHKLLWPEHDGSRPKNPILYFALNPEVDELALPGAEVTPLEYDWQSIPPGVETWLIEKKDTLSGAVRWAAGRLDMRVCEELMSAFVARLELR